MQGMYFITICTHKKLPLFGEIKNKKMRLNNLGKIVDREVLKIASHYQNIQIDKYIIMPNHIHMIIAILETDENNTMERINPFPTIKYDIPNVIGKFKAGVTRNAGNAFMHSAKKGIWQRSFHDHIIHGEKDYQKLWEYIDTNPLKWEEDCFYI